MTGRPASSMALILAAALPIAAQSGLSAQVMDFWTAVGRFARAGAATDADSPPDLSGTYAVQGSTGSKTYSTTMDISRWKTYTTPLGAKFNVYKTRYNWSDGKVTGIGVLLGHRFYAAYGSEHLALYMAAPFTLSEDEKPAYARYRDAYRLAEAKNATAGRHTLFEVKDKPWFAESYQGGAAFPDPAYFALWVAPFGSYGYKFYGSMPRFAEGKYFVGGYFLKDNGKEETLGLNPSRWQISQIGENYKIVQKETDSDAVDGTAMPLDDGIVVMVLGGNDDCGVGVYDIKNNTLTGPYTSQYGKDRGSETLTPSASVLAKNAKLFGQ